MRLDSTRTSASAHHESPRREPSEPEAIQFPEKSPGDWAVAVLLFAFSVLYLWTFRDYTVFNADEGVLLQGAERILRGEVLYRDFFSFYTPGSYFELVLIFKVFGNSLLAARTLLVIYGGLFSVLTYLLARRVCARWSAALAAYLLLVVCVPYRFLVLHNWDSTLWALLALYCSVWLLQAPGWKPAFGTGSFVALTFLFEQSKGVGLVLGLTAGFAFLTVGRRRWPLAARPAMAVLAGLSWPFLMTVCYFASQHSLREMLAGWLWPVRHYAAANALPYGHLILSSGALEEFYADPSRLRQLLLILVASPCFILPALPVLSLALLGFHAFKLCKEREAEMVASYYVLVCATSLGLVLSTLLTRRADFTHLLYIAPPLFVALAWIVEGQGIGLELVKSVRPVLAVILLIFFTAFGMTLLLPALNARLRLETRRGVLRIAAPDSVVKYVQRHVPPGGRMFVYPYQPLYYFLTATFSPTRFDYLQPGLHTPEQFQEANQQLATARIQFVFFDPSFVGEKIPQAWPSTPTAALVKDPIRDFIFLHYRPCRALPSQHWRFVFMVRKDLSCPSASGAK